MSTIITFLNDKGLKADAVYEWQGQTYPGGVFCLALRQFVPHARMLVCNTPEATDKTWPFIAALKDPRIEPIPIPKGESTTELWQMFDAITTQIKVGESVVFDITHGLRSLPFLVFLFAAYLKSAKQVKIEAIYYGALELADFRNGKPAPVIDLSEFVQMLDWLTATDQFVQTGDARRLAGLLNPNDDKRGAAWAASQKLSDVSLAAFLCQPFTLMREAQTLDASLRAAETELTTLAHPFEAVRGQIVSTFGAFGANFDPAQPREALRAQFGMIEWYYSNTQLTQAMTLAREWVISAVANRLGEPLDLTLKAREDMGWALSGNARIGREEKDKQTGLKYVFGENQLSDLGRRVAVLPEAPALRDVWNLLSAPRNQLDHAEHQTSLMALNKIANKASEIMPRLRDLAVKWGLA